MAKNAVVVKFLADIDGLKRGVDGINGKLSGLGKSMKAFGLTLAASFSTKAILDFTKAAIGAASDLEESYSKVGAVFKDQAIAIELWAKDSVKNFGLSQQAALEAAGTFGNLFTAFGVGVPEAREMSIVLTELAADLASFNNTSIDQALTALRSGLSGETEPLKRFGVALSQAAIEAEALALGLIKSGDEMDQAAKSQAIYSLVMKQTTNAQGDFLRTSDGLANTMRTLEAAVENAQARIGRGLLQAVKSASDAAGGGGGLADTIDEVAIEFETLTLGIASAIRKLEELADKGNDVEEEERQLERQTRSLWKAFLSGGDPLVGTGVLLQTIFYNLGVVEDRTLNNIQAQKLLEAGYRANASQARDNAKANYELAASYDVVLRKLGNLPNDKILRTERQGDSFLRGFNDGDSTWRRAIDDAAELRDTLDEVGKVGGSSVSKVGDEADKSVKKVKNFTAQIGDFTLSVAQKAAKGKKISADAIKAMTEAGQEAIQGLLDDLAQAEKQLVETQNFIAQQTASFLGPTSVKAVQQQYAAAKSEAEQLARAYDRAKKAREDAESTGTPAERVKQLREAEAEAKKAADEAGAKAARGFTGFWEDAQKAVVAYRDEIEKLRKSFAADGVITDAEAQILQDIFTLPPDSGTQVIEQLLTDTGKALTANQQVIQDQTEAWIGVITDTFEGKNGFPAVGLTTAQQTREDFIKELTSDKTKKKMRKAVRAAVPKSVKVRVEWEYAPFQPNIPSSVNSSRSRTIQDIQAYERMNGSKWRERVR